MPYEVLNKRFRSAQKNIDREVSHVQATMSDMDKCLQNQPVTVREMSKVLDGVVEKLNILKRKVNINYFCSIISKELVSTYILKDI